MRTWKTHSFSSHKAFKKGTGLILSKWMSIDAISRSNPKLFKRDTWKQKSSPEHRQWVLGQFNKQSSNLNWTHGVPILPMFHGTNEHMCWKIAQTGFATVATLDAGWYGKGIYFTSNLEYARHYSQLALSNSTGTFHFVILSLVSPGNPFPVIEHPEMDENLLGSSVVDGYSSHYVCVDSHDHFPASKDSTHFYDELVIFQEHQALPMYILVLDSSS